MLKIVVKTFFFIIERDYYLRFTNFVEKQKLGVMKVKVISGAFRVVTKSFI